MSSGPPNAHALVGLADIHTEANLHDTTRLPGTTNLHAGADANLSGYCYPCPQPVTDLFPDGYPLPDQHATAYAYTIPDQYAVPAAASSQQHAD